MARTAEEAAKTLVYYIKLALGERVQGDMHAELDSVIQDFAAIDGAIADHHRVVAPMRKYGGRNR